MKITILTLFPQIFEPVLSTSILGRAAKQGLVEFEMVDLRPFGEGVHQVVDGRPYGGGVGMVLRADILAKAIKKIKDEGYVILTSASGKPLKQSRVRELAQKDHLVIICGHYEGVDQRFIDKYVDEEISLGDFVLTGGEIPAMALADAVTRLISGVLKKEEAVIEESFTENLLEYPQYTRPDDFEGLKVPEVLLSGNHQEVAKWRKEQSVKKTQQIRPDLLTSVN